MDIFFDSKAATQALSFSSVRSQLVEDWRKELASVSHRFEIILVWVPGHWEIGNLRKWDSSGGHGRLARGSQKQKSTISNLDREEEFYTIKFRVLYGNARQIWNNYEMCKENTFKITIVCAVDVYASGIGPLPSKCLDLAKAMPNTIVQPFLQNFRVQPPLSV